MNLNLSNQVCINNATAVLLAMEAYAKDKTIKNLDLQIGYYENGRESGFSIVNEKNWKAVSFSENRNSTSTVVYFGMLETDFEAYGMPTDATYENAKYFPPTVAGYKAAAIFMLNFLRK